MKIKLILFFALISFFINAQISYNFTALAGVYTPNAAPTTIHAAGTNDGTSGNINFPAGMTFNFGCINYTRVRVNANGYLSLNTLAGGAGNVNNLTTGGNRPIIAPLWDDLQVDATGTVNYQFTGVSPNRVLTVEWKNMRWSLGAGGPVISFQVKLYESTHATSPNRIEFIYSQNATAVTCDGASIGIAGVNSGDFYSLNNSSAAPTASKLLETTSICTKPANNQVYQWDPNICAGAPVGGNAVATPSTYCNSFTTTLSLTGQSQGCGLTYQWQSAPAAVGPWTNISGATNVTAVQTVTAPTYYRCIITCTNSGLTATSGVATTTIVPPVGCPICNIRSVPALPYSQLGQTTCGEINDVTSTNASQVCGSSLYYGGEDVVYSFTPTATGGVTINVTTPNTYLGITAYLGCPVSGGTCEGASQSSGATASLCISVIAGQVYYLIIDSWPSPACIGFDMSISAPSACAGSIAGAVAAVSNGTAACAPKFANLSLSGVTACGASYQWQSGPTSTGPWTNLSGGTTSTYQATLTSSCFVQCLLTCGASTAVSNALQFSVSPAPVVPCALSTYTAAPTTYSFEVFAGTVLPTTDDVLFNTIVNLGFQFCYGGSSYWGGYVASNGAFVLDAVPCYPNILTATYAAGGVGTGFSIPSPAPSYSTSIPRNAILGPWQDINPSLGGTIQYYTTGTAPNRKFVVSYESIPMYSCGTASPSIYFTGQIKLYETTNNIEIHVGNKGVCPSFNSGRAVMGLHSYDGTVYVPPVNMTAHNSPTQWTMTNTAYLFQSPCAVNSGPCAVLPIAFKNFYGENISTVNKLTWETAEETDVKEFLIERSTDGINFYQIGAQTPNNKPSKYIYNDNTFKSNVVNYYRITAVENNNSKKSTYVIPIGGSYDALTVSEIFPNPTDNNFAISFTSKTENNLTIKIKDMFGREVSKSNHDIHVGVSQVFVDCNRLNSGVYIVEVVDSNLKTISQQKLAITK